MKILEIILLLFLLIAIGMGLYVLWINLPSKTVEYSSNYENSQIKVIVENITNHSQFYQKMRYSDRAITYKIEKNCDDKKRRDITEAFSILSSKTVLTFASEMNNSQIVFLCSEVASTPEQKTHFIAGEGGPTEIINTTLYYLILSGKVALYRPEKCNETKVALHEILHALGFDHSSNNESIMYPITDCSQKLDQYIINDINEIYKEPPVPDLAIEEIVANRTGRYLSFKITVNNQGLKNAESVNLTILSRDKLIKNFDLEDIPIGTKKLLTATNLRTPYDSEEITFLIEDIYNQKELSYENNKRQILLKSSS